MEKGIITKEEFLAEFKKLDREMKEKGRKVPFEIIDSGIGEG